MKYIEDIENADHFFLKCMLYNEHRLELFRKVSQFCDITLDVLLKGNSTLLKPTWKYSNPCKGTYSQPNNFEVTCTLCTPPSPEQLFSYFVFLSFFSTFPSIPYLLLPFEYYSHFFVPSIVPT